MKISITIPTINRVDLLYECLEPILKHRDIFERIYIIDNGKQDLSKIIPLCKGQNVEFFLSPENLGVAGSWNEGIRYLKSDSHWVFILNDDIVLSEESILQLPALVKKNRGKWLITSECSYSAFLVNMHCLEHMEYSPDKYFDEAFYPAYCEDVDFEWRIKLIDPFRLLKNVSELNPKVYRRKGSTEADPTLNKYKEVRSHFVEKWGRGPRKPKYVIPFNGTKPWPENGEEEMHIQVAVQCHYYQKRLCWMLSSMLRQALPKNMHISMSIAYVEGTGNPSTEEVIDYFKEQGLDVKGVSYPDTTEFQYRGWTRNKQLEQCDADWILFADCDMIYPPNFFNVAYTQLQLDKYKDNPHCLHSGRYSTTLNETEDLVNSYEYPCVIENTTNLVQYLPGKHMANIGAGFCQLVNVKLVKESDTPYYCEPGKKIDYSYDKFHKTKSDQRFRRRLGREKIPLPLQYHLQHLRDNEVGYHIELQR